MTRLVAIALLTFLPGAALGQAPPPEAAPTPRPTPQRPIVSPEVHADRRVTFRLRAPAVKEVLLSGEWSRDRTPMVKDAEGDWAVTVGPLESDLYGYSFIADGFTMVDPANAQLKLARSPRTSIVDVPGDRPRMDEFQDVPHGTVRLHTYVSRSLGRKRGLTVYTPPDYEKDAARRYPVLYMLHGSGDNEATWISLGRAHWILDNLIAQGRTPPMLMVFADGHPIHPTPPGPQGALQNAEAFERDLVEDVLPFIEASYRVQKEAAGRALSGVSMGGGHALLFGLRHPDVFGWVLGLSGSVFDPETAQARAATDAKSPRHSLLWFTCGRTDRLLPGNEALAAALKAKGVPHTFEANDGEHNWRQWRRYLVQIGPMLFAGAGRS